VGVEVTGASILKDNKAISPLIGVVMLTLLTIIFATVISSSSLTGILQGYSTNIGMGRLDGGTLEGDTITLSHNGGEPFTFLENTKVLIEIEGESIELNISNLYGTTIRAGETVNVCLTPLKPENTGKIGAINAGDTIFLKVVDGDQKLVILRQEIIV
jgi:flagellin-like protein